MNLKDWMHTTNQEERKRVAEHARTSVGYLWQLAGNHRNPSKGLAERLEAATTEVTPDRVIDKVSALFGKAAA